MKIALAQMKMDTDIEKNFQKSLQLIREAAEKKADLICFPEIQLSPFFPQFPDCDVSEYLLSIRCIWQPLILDSEVYICGVHWNP